MRVTEKQKHRCRERPYHGSYWQSARPPHEKGGHSNQGSKKPHHLAPRQGTQEHTRAHGDSD